MLLSCPVSEEMGFSNSHVVQHKAVTKKGSTDLGFTYRHSTNLQIQACLLDCITFIFKDLQNSETEQHADFQKKGKRSSKKYRISSYLVVKGLQDYRITSSLLSWVLQHLTSSLLLSSFYREWLRNEAYKDWFAVEIYSFQLLWPMLTSHQLCSVVLAAMNQGTLIKLRVKMRVLMRSFSSICSYDKHPNPCESFSWLDENNFHLERSLIIPFI